MGNDVVSGVLDDYDEDEEEEKKGSNGSLNIRSAYVSRKISCSFLRISQIENTRLHTDVGENSMAEEDLGISYSTGRQSDASLHMPGGAMR